MRTRVGYAGGTKPSPTYRSLGDHTESIQIDFDPKQISYDQLLAVFWKSHDPTQRPYSRQYMSAVFCQDDEQRRQAEASKTREEARLKARIHTEIRPAAAFTLAEDYHQKYYLRNVRSLMQDFAANFSREADFVASTAAARLNGYVGGNAAPAQVKRELPLLGLSEAGQKRLLEILRLPPALTCGQ